ncbi:MAG: hypothetical protein WAM58_01555 [Candidatus Acidiferrum sp.]
MKLRRDSIVTVLVLLGIAIALPFAIIDTFEKGRVYVFSKQFLKELSGSPGPDASGSSCSRWLPSSWGY